MKTSSLLGVCALFAYAFSGVPAFAQNTNPFNQTPTRIIGQPRVTPVTNGNPNYVQGAEMFSPLSVAVDNSVSPPILYVADAFNNRVLVYKSPSTAVLGAPADLVIGQQDAFSTIPQGPGQNSSVGLSEGFTLPTSVLVDNQGNLYVADAGNNRVIRYPQPFQQQSPVLQADLVIGQTSLVAGTSANQGFANPTSMSLSLTGFHTGLAFSAAGDLWVSDPGNNRVLRFPASQLLPYTMSPAADIVLGQTDFATSTFSPGNVPNTQLAKAALSQPSGLAFDAAGRLYICDNQARVSVWLPPFNQFGNSATRVLGAQIASNEPVSATKLGGTQTSNYSPPEGVFTIGNNVFVVDTANNRIVRYDPYETWPAETATSPSPAATLVVGQPSFGDALPNRGSLTDASGASLASPSGAVATATEVYVADTGNNRVLGFPITGGNSFSNADQLFGQTQFWQLGVNHVGPNGFYFSALSNSLGGNVAVDYNSNPPRLYLADPGNNRVLGYPDARNVNAGDPAAIVIGQIDFEHQVVNLPGGNPLQMSDLGLSQPSGVAVDASGNLWVADSGNGRVLRFPSPFNVQGGQQRANLALGQVSLFGQPQVQQATSNQMRNPWGIAFLFDGSVFISDPANNRVLLFRKPAGGDFATGQAATSVYGQTSFTTTAAGTTLDKLNGPRFISTDTDDRLYVADTGNNRVTIYRQQATQQPSGFAATATIANLNGPIGVTVSPLSGYIWVANTNGNTVLQYPQFTDYQLNPTAPPNSLSADNPLAIALDPQGNPVVTEAINRVSLYYPYFTFQSAANQSDRALAPGMIANLLLPYGAFAQQETKNTDIPWPVTLGDIEVDVAGVAAPITDVQPNSIQFQVPQNVPLGQADFVVRHTSNGQVIASATLITDVAAPGFYVVGAGPGGGIVAKNPDGTANGPSNPVKRGEVIQLFGTGIGVVPNMPPDGTAPTDQLPASGSIQTLIFTNLVPQSAIASTIKYFGLAPGQVGAFELDLVVPANAVPFQANPVVFTYMDLRSNLGPGGTTVSTTVYVQ
jgi:uncharacterized protein (TIGR03437 family)